MQLNNDEIRRYSRHLILPEVGLAGQKKIKATSVLCIGAGGLGSPIAMYLAAAGIGKIGGGFILCDDYGFPSCPGARSAVDRFFAGKTAIPLCLPTGQALIFKGGV